MAKLLVPNVDFHQADIISKHSLGKYRAAILMEVFEHIPPEATHHFVHATAKLISEGGLLVVTVPHENKPLEYKHFRHYSLDSLNGFFTPYFEIEQVIFLEKIGWFNRLLKGLVANRIYALTNRRVLRAIYRLYGAKVFTCSREIECARFAVCYRRKADAIVGFQ